MGHPQHMNEVFKQTHVGKGTLEFVDERSRKTHISTVLFCYLFYYNMYMYN